MSDRLTELGDQLRQRGIDPKVVKDEVHKIVSEMAETDPTVICRDVTAPSSMGVPCLQKEEIDPKAEINKILMTHISPVADLGSVQPSPEMTVSVTSKRPGKQREVAPGIMVSQKLIDEAVRLTTDPQTMEAVDRIEKKREAQARARLKEKQELARDLAVGQEIIQGMLQRAREPYKHDEKFVSFDTMPKPLQRVIKAYIDAEAAGRELNEAVLALGKDLQPPVIKPE